MDKPLLDEHCKNIFSVLLVSNKPLRFNELWRNSNALGLKMSRPTLSQHLHHLQKYRVITRKREGKQNISYRVNWEKFKTLKQSVDYRQKLSNMLENEKRFKSFPIDEQAVYVTNVLTLRGLYKLNLEVQDTLDPSKNFEHSLQFLLINRFFEIFKIWFLESCKSSKENGEKAQSMIERNIGRLKSELFDQIPKPT